MSKTNTFFGICCLLYVFLFPNYNFGQGKMIKGQVQNLTNDVTNVLVVNLNSKKSTITDSLGFFSIEAKLRDSIRFTAVQYVTKVIVITDTIFLKYSLSVYLTEDLIKLNEVIVTPYNLTGQIDLDIERLGIEPIVTSSSQELPNVDVEVGAGFFANLCYFFQRKQVTYFVVGVHQAHEGLFVGSSESRLQVFQVNVAFFVDADHLYRCFARFSD